MFSAEDDTQKELLLISERARDDAVTSRAARQRKMNADGLRDVTVVTTCQREPKASNRFAVLILEVI